MDQQKNGINYMIDIFTKGIDYLLKCLQRPFVSDTCAVK